MKTESLMKCFHSYINLHSEQMFSYLKYLDIINEKITFTFFGNTQNIYNLYTYVKKNYLDSATIIYKKSEKDYLLVCKNKTCSLPITKLDELKNYTEKNNIK